jgi:cyclopropane fatty-acyl-phospholipid synthase-like methyltransferase
MPEPYVALDTYQDIGARYQIAFDRVPGQVRSVEWLISQLPKGSRFVDIGCGTGRPVCEMLALAGHDVQGVDLTPNMIKAAKEQVPNAKFEVADGREWQPSPLNGQLDAVTSYFAFLAGTKQEDGRQFFKRAYSWLRPGGLFVYGTVPLDAEDVELQWMGRRY